MFWWWRLRGARPYLDDTRGTKQYAEHCAALVASNAIAEWLKIQSAIHDVIGDCEARARVLRQKWNKLRDLASIDTPGATPIDPEEFERLTLKIRRARWV